MTKSAAYTSASLSMASLRLRRLTAPLRVEAEESNLGVDKSS